MKTLVIKLQLLKCVVTCGNLVNPGKNAPVPGVDCVLVDEWKRINKDQSTNELTTLLVLFRVRF